ncbi:MAG: hypothetical protein P9M03_01565, partial [Candidatus Theseobacter exili]|nr:hypothetical protein [Candidatus Theseobacter exili]
MKSASGLEYKGISEAYGPIIVIRNIHNVGFNELVEIRDVKGYLRLGLVLESAESMAVVQVLEGTMGLNLPDTKVRFREEPLMLPVSESLMGRVFDGIGRPIDGGPDPICSERRDVNGLIINPTSRDYPRKYIQTGISAIDGMNTLIRGQKLPIFSGNGLPHNTIAAQIARQAKIVGEDTGFAVVFAAMGIKYDAAQFFIRNFEDSGVLDKVVLFLNLADDPPIERLVTPRAA